MSYQRYISTAASIGILTATVLLIAACGLQPVSSIRVKTSPELYLPLGTKSYSMDQYISPDFITGMGTGDTSSERKAQVYYYNPPKNDNPDQLRYLVHFPLQSFTFDVSKYFGTEGTGTILSRNFDTSIDVPTIEKSEKTWVDSSKINNNLLEAFNKNGTLNPIQIPAGGGGSVTKSINIQFEGFRTLTFGRYSNSALIISHQSSTVNYSITSAKLIITGTSAIIEGENYYNYDESSNAIRFPLDERTIGKQLSLTITIAVNNTTGGNIAITRKLKGTISRAEGVNADLDDIDLAEGTIENITLPEGFRSAEIGEGSVKLDVKQPSEWQGISIQHKTSIKQDGADGLAITPAAFTASEISLAGQKLNNSTRFTYKPVLKVTLNDATYTYEYTQQIYAECTLAIKKFAKITLENRKDFSKTQKEPAPADMKQWVQSIQFNKVTAKVTLSNGLPEGNPVAINLKSDVFKIDGTDGHGTSGVFLAQTQNVTKDYPSSQDFGVNIATLDGFDLTSTVLPGIGNPDGTFTLKNIATGKKAEFSGKVTFDLDWASMVVKADGTQNALSYPKNGSLSLSMLSKLKEAGIKLHKMPMYFYAGSDSSLLANTSVHLDLSIESIYENAAPKTTSLINKTESLKALPADIFKDAKGEDGKIKTFDKEIPNPMFTANNLHEILNTYPDSFRFHYKISMDNGISITRAQYDQAKKEHGNAAINVDLLLDSPLGFTVDGNDGPGLEIPSQFGDKPIELDNAFGNIPLTKDQLMIRKLQLNANLQNKFGFEPEFTLRMKNKDKTPILDDKIVSLRSGSQELKFTDKEWQKLKEAGSFIPQLYFKMPKGEHILKKDIGLGVTLSVTVAADVDYQVYDGSGSKQPDGQSYQEPHPYTPAGQAY